MDTLQDMAFATVSAAMSTPASASSRHSEMLREYSRRYHKEAGEEASRVEAATGARTLDFRSLPAVKFRGERRPDYAYVDKATGEEVAPEEYGRRYMNYVKSTRKDSPRPKTAHPASSWWRQEIPRTPSPLEMQWWRNPRPESPKLKSRWFEEEIDAVSPERRPTSPAREEWVRESPRARIRSFPVKEFPREVQESMDRARSRKFWE
jgi:hypothetical protein